MANRFIVEVIDVSGHKPRRIPSAKWRELIKKVWEADPLMCPKCQKEMRMVEHSRRDGFVSFWRRSQQNRSAWMIRPASALQNGGLFPILTFSPAFPMIFTIKTMFQVGLNGQVSVPPEKRFLILLCLCVHMRN